MSREQHPEQEDELRRRAEERLREVPEPEEGTAPDLQRLVHELQVHQIELELQNEELRRAREETEAERERYLDLYDFAPVGYLTLDSTGAIRSCNLTAAAWLGMERARLLGWQFEFFLAPGARSPFQSFLATVRAGQVPAAQEAALQANGRPGRVVQIEATPIEEEQEARVALVDVTARKQAEQEREQLLQQQKQLLGEVEEARQLSEARNRINALLISSLAVAAALPEVLAEAVRALGLDSGVLSWREGESWIIRHVYGLSQELAGRAFSRQEAELSEWAIQHWEVVVVDDVYGDPRFSAETARRYGLRALLIIPLILQERVLGVLTLNCAAAPVHFRPAQVDFAKKLATMLALALENARLYEQARQDAETKATLLGEVNHRVKNNLAAIIGLLYAQMDRPEAAVQPEYQEAILEVTRRVEGLAVVHRMLSASQWMPLRLDQLAERIIGTTLQTVPAGQLTIAVAPSPVCVSPDQAHSLALVLSELALNVGKHALPAGRPVHLTVSATVENKSAVLIFRDNGPGYSEEVLAGWRAGVGLGLLRNLVTQNLRGQLTLRNEAGAVAEIRFPLAEAAEEDGERG